MNELKLDIKETTERERILNGLASAFECLAIHLHESREAKEIFDPDEDATGNRFLPSSAGRRSVKITKP